MKATTTTYTCDRCGSSKSYPRDLDARDRLEPEPRPWEEEWVVLWQLQGVAPIGSYLQPDGFGHACTDCLTEAERESITEQRLAIHIPF